MNYKDKITSDLISRYNDNYQQANIVTMPSGSKFAILNLAFNIKSSYQANTDIEIMYLPVEIITKKNVVLLGINDKKFAISYIRAETRAVVFIPSIDITPDMEIDIIGTYQID